MSIFKAYDIRGIVGTELTEDIAKKIGRAFATFLQPKSIVIGRDMRPHSPGICDALTEGLTMQGVDVVDLGMVSTPMSYFANGKLGADGSIIVTASHNPGEYNGMKLCRAAAVPISGATGIKEIERIVMEEDFAAIPETPGSITEVDIADEYKAHIRSFAKIESPLHICIDYANAMGIKEGEVFEGLFSWDSMFDTYDGSFPNHEANPLDPETFDDIQG